MIRELRQIDSSLNELTDAQARPTAPYVEMSFGMGKDGYPAISMTQHANATIDRLLSVTMEDAEQWMEDEE